MAESKLPYVTAYGNITRVLEKIKTAATPDRFSQDFLSTKLGMSGGGARPVIPFLKRTGFLAQDGSPTDLYKRFRNPGESGAATAEALRRGFAPIYEINEYAHALDEPDLSGLAVQVTGLEKKAPTVKSVVKSFKALDAFADHDAKPAPVATAAAAATPAPDSSPDDEPASFGIPNGVNLGYTINLNLPATSDIAVFDAIFRSLREHILR